MLFLSLTLHLPEVRLARVGGQKTVEAMKTAEESNKVETGMLMLQDNKPVHTVSVELLPHPLHS